MIKNQLKISILSKSFEKSIFIIEKNYFYLILKINIFLILIIEKRNRNTLKF